MQSQQKRHFKGVYLHFSQNLPVKPSTHWHCCQDQWSKQVPPCLQGLAVQAPSSLGHLQTHRPTIRQSVWHVGCTVGSRGVHRKGNSKNKRGRWAVISLLIQKKPMKNPEKISILKDLSSLHYSPAGQKEKKSLAILRCFSPLSKICHFFWKKHLLKSLERVWECEQMSHSESRGG